MWRGETRHGRVAGTRRGRSTRLVISLNRLPIIIPPPSDLPASGLRLCSPPSMDTSHNLPIPRLRLTRHSPPSRADTLNTPIAGPSHSRTSPEALRAHFYDEEDAEATPRMPTARIADSPEAAITPTLPLDTPAARLRMVLARVPNNRSPPRASTSRLPQPTTPSEPDSDLDPPYSITATPSIAKESLREIFSHALRGSETTPQKPKRRVRRNSVGSASEVDPSPRVEHVQQERTRNKGKRRSMSDEEAEHLSSAFLFSPEMAHWLTALPDLSRRSEESTTTSRSARWDALTAVLTGGQSSTMPPTPPPERAYLLQYQKGAHPCYEICL